jgi:hypothetical protein
LLVKRRYVDAEAAFRGSLIASQDEVHAARGLATALARQNRHEEVVKELYGLAIQLRSPSLSCLLADSARVMALRGVTEYADTAIELYTRSLSQKEDAVAYFYLGLLYEEIKADRIKAAEAYHNSLRLDPHSPTVQSALKRCNGDEQKWSPA